MLLKLEHRGRKKSHRTPERRCTLLPSSDIDLSPETLTAHCLRAETLKTA